ncbi:hypothetical protein DASC09_062430 [Saccharomycopsis crataegensis]|uniref:Uncharacterized protein n=1 Tax=Saccharomycopsis crataegensis TaxID=43959 RepID=A0AAV5QW26_9ASCO|nr:hypothetical protein DASC09_062430 [Saccharomycopsis crataegensis]
MAEHSSSASLSTPNPRLTKKSGRNILLNEDRPLRIAVLGGTSVGKTSYISKLTSGIFPETHYPTPDFSTTLFKLSPVLRRSRVLLDELADSAALDGFVKSEKNQLCVSQGVKKAFEYNDSIETVLSHTKISEGNYNNERILRLIKKNQNVPSDLSLQSDFYTYYYDSSDFKEFDNDDFYYPVQLVNSTTSIKNSRVLSGRIASESSTKSAGHTPPINSTISHSSLGSTVSPTNSAITLDFPVPHISPVLVELIDTPAFNPDLIVPFLELSLGARLGEEFLHNLSRDPRTAVATKALLVGSAASELNGFVDGYVLVYSAVPSTMPPSYDSCDSLPLSGTEESGAVQPQLSASDSLLNDASSFSLLESMRSVILESWKSYKLYLRQHEAKSETDIFSLTSSVKHLWKANKRAAEEEKLTKKALRQAEAEQNITITEGQSASQDPTAAGSSNTPNESSSSEKKTAKYRSKNKKLIDDLDLSIPLKKLEFQVPITPSEVPPLLVICTHSQDPLASPFLIEKGRKLAQSWDCGFSCVDNEMGMGVEESLAELVREIVEREKQKRLNVTKNSMVNKIKKGIF